METADPAIEQIDAEGNGSGSPRSVIEALRAQRASHVAERIFEIDVPGYRGLLMLRCRPIRGDQLGKIVDRANASKSPERNVNANSDTLIAACQEVLGRTADTEPWTTLVDEEGTPVRLDHTLADLLGLTARSARDVVMQVFGGANSPELAIGAAAGEYAEWAAQANADIDEDLLGESLAAPR